MNTKMRELSIKKLTVNQKKTICGFDVEILSTKFVIDPWGNEKNTMYNTTYNRLSGRVKIPNPHYVVQISKGCNSAQFEFTDSIHSFEANQPSSLESILTCILDDAAMFEKYEALDDREGAENIMSAFGYEDLKKARDVYRALHETYLKIKPMVSEEELYRILNEDLQEYK